MTPTRSKTAGILLSLLAVAIIVACIAYFYTRSASQDDLVVYVNEADTDQAAALSYALLEASNSEGVVTKLVVDETKIGSDKTARVGDTVEVHYIGVVEAGKEFDNTYKKGETLTFVIGEGEMVPGFERGIIGMQVGGTRTLIVPAHLAYGNEKVGRILPNSTLIFLVELVSIQ